MQPLQAATHQNGHPRPAAARAVHRVVLETTDEGLVHLEVRGGDEVAFKAMRRGGLREGLRLVELFLAEGPEGFAPKLRGAEYIEIAQALVTLPAGERFTSHRVTDLVYEEGVHDRALVLKNVSSALTKLRKREVAYFAAHGKQGKSILYELSSVPTVAEVVSDLQD